MCFGDFLTLEIILSIREKEMNGFERARVIAALEEDE